MDAICINQADNVEKSVQVSRMGRIFSNCSGLLIWLGDADNHDEKAFELMRQIGHDYASANLAQYGELGARVLNTSDTEALGALSRARERAYWYRLWIVQEITLSIPRPSCRQQQVLCGPFEIPFRHWSLANLMLSMRNIEAVQRPRWEPLSDAGYRQAPSLESWHGVKVREFTLASNLWEHRVQDCSDPRDRVYALLGVSSGVDKYGIVPNYELDIRQVLCKCAALFVQLDKDITFLGACWTGWTIHQGLPSWVPHWYVSTTFRGQKYLVMGTQHGVDHRFRSGISQAAHAEVSADLRYLKLRCLLLGVVATTETPWIEPAEALPSPVLHEVVRTWADSVTAHHARCFDTRISQLEAFIRTVLCNTSMELALLDDSHLALFELWARNGGNVSSTQLTDSEEFSMGILEADVEISITHRRFLILEGGYMALGPADTEVGDVLAIPYGSQAPFVFRNAEDDSYTLIGACYVHGVMEGEAFEQPLKGTFTTEDLTII